MEKSIGIFILLSLSISSLSVQGLMLEDKEEVWNIAILDVSFQQIHGEILNLGKQVGELLALLKNKRLSLNEVSLMRERVREKALQAGRKTIHTYYKEMDELLFKNYGSIQRARKRYVLKGKIRSEEKKLQSIRNYPAEKIMIVRQRKISFHIINEKQPALFLSNIRVFAHKNNYDQVLFFTLIDNETLKEFTVNIYNRLADTVTPLLKQFLSLKDRSFLAHSLAVRVAPAIVGYPVASLRVWVLKEEQEEEKLAVDASIYINGELQGYGEAGDLFRQAGEVEVTVHTPDGDSQTRTLQLELGETRELYVYKQYHSTELVKLFSIPSGAAVYRGSVRVGRTPMHISRPLTQQYLEFRKTGFRYESLILSPDSPDLFTLTLHKESEDLSLIMRNKRKQFYTSLAVLAFSIPLPMVFSALYKSRKPYINPQTTGGLSPVEYKKNLQYYNGYYGAFWASLGVTLSLTGYMLYRLIEYIRAVR